MKDSRAQESIWRRSYLAPSYMVGTTEHVYALQVLGSLLASGPGMRPLSAPVALQLHFASAGGIFAYQSPIIAMAQMVAFKLPAISSGEHGRSE